MVIKSFLAVARLSFGVVRTVSHAMIGFKLAEDRPVELTFGRLRASFQYELRVPSRDTRCLRRVSSTSTAVRSWRA